MTLLEMQMAIDKAIADGVDSSAEIVCSLDGDGETLFYADIEGDWAPLEPPLENDENGHPLGLQALAVELRLTPLQITELNSIGETIQDGVETLDSIKDTLSEAEFRYLKKWVDTYPVK